MSSQGTGSTSRPDVAMDLLHKFITESTTVRAAFVSGPGVMAVVSGVVKRSPDGVSVAVMPKQAFIGSPTLMFNPSGASPNIVPA